MKKLEKILKDRKFYHKSDPLKIFENRLKDMMNLIVTVISQDVNDSVKNEARKQYLVTLVACYETFTREMFKKIIEDNIVPIEEISNLRKFKDVKFTIEEIIFIKKHNIAFSELLTQYINFQNFGELIGVFSIINLDKKINEKIEEKDNKMPPPDLKKIKDKDPSEFANEFFKQFTKHKKMFDKEGLFRTINILLDIRHKIVHQNINVKIKQDELLTFTAAIYEFITMLDIIIQEAKT